MRANLGLRVKREAHKRLIRGPGDGQMPKILRSVGASWGRPHPQSQQIHHLEGSASFTFNPIVKFESMIHNVSLFSLNLNA